METLKERIKRLCKENGTTMANIEKELGISKGYLSKIDKIAPSSDKIDLLSKRFNVSQEFLLYGEDKKDTDNGQYYLDKDARELAQFLFENPEYKVLFDASRNVRKEDIQFIKEFMDRMSVKMDDTGC